MSIKVILIAVIMLAICNVSAGYAFQDKVYKYSIQFPKGWKVEKVNLFGNVGMQATSKYGAQIMIGAARQDTSHIEYTDEFARYFTQNVTYPMARQMCDHVTVISATAVTVLDKYDGITNDLKCDDYRVQTMYFVNNGITYTINTAFNQADREGLRALFKSLKTFKVN